MEDKKEEKMAVQLKSFFFSRNKDCGCSDK